MSMKQEIEHLKQRIAFLEKKHPEDCNHDWEQSEPEIYMEDRNIQEHAPLASYYYRYEVKGIRTCEITKIIITCKKCGTIKELEDEKVLKVKMLDHPRIIM